MAQSNMPTVARPYARAAFDIALAHDALPAWSNMLELLAAVVTDERVADIIGDPRFDYAQKAEQITAICRDELDELGRNFVKTLAKHERLVALPEIAAQFADARADHERQARIQVVSAYPLSEAQQNTLAEALARRLNREISITTLVDKSLIGGVIVHAGDTVIDGSIRGRLAQLRSALTA